MFYIFDKNFKPVKVHDHVEWAKFFEDPTKRTVKKDDINGVYISTVFLGLDHRYGEGEPLLWETMCFSENHDYDGYQARYSSYEDALMGHIYCLSVIKAKGDLNSRKTLKIKL